MNVEHRAVSTFAPPRALGAALYFCACALAAVLLALLLSGCVNQPYFPDRQQLRWSETDARFDVPRAKTLTVHVLAYSAPVELLGPCRTNDITVLGCADIEHLYEGVCQLHMLTPTSHIVMGHEFRHCLEGRFHD